MLRPTSTLVIGAAALGVSILPAARGQTRSDRVRWLREHEVVVDSLASTTAFSRIASAIGGSSVVFLGESTHGDGRAHEIRTDLVRYLHEHAGFDVVIWEAGLYDGARLDSALAGSSPLDSIASIALYYMWARSAELRPLLTYLRETKASQRPMTFAGFDLQRSGPLRALFDDVRRTFMTVDASLFPRALADSVDSLFVAAARGPSARRFALEVTADTLLARRAPELLATLNQNPQRFASSLGTERLSFLQHVLANMGDYVAMLRAGHDPARSQTVTAAGFDARERANAENLLWLVRTRFVGRKVVVWTHNVHAAAARFDSAFATIALENQAGSFDGMGLRVKRALGDSAYSVGLATFSGQWAYPGFGANVVQTPDSNSLTALLHDIGGATAFLDFRSARMGAPWLFQPVPDNIDGQHPGSYPVRWGSAFDGVLFIDRMTPSTVAKP